MKLLFVHDHKFKTSSYNEFYSAGTFPQHIWDRYLTNFDSITVLARNDNANPYSEQDLASYSYSSHPKVDFKLVEGASNITTLLGFKKPNIRIIGDLVNKHDAIIVRLHSELAHQVIKVAIENKIPYAIELVECPWDSLWNYGGIKPKVYAPICYFRTKLALKKASFVLYVTKDFLQNRYPAPYAVTTNCSNVEIPFISREVLEARLQKISKLNSNDKIILGQIASLTGKFKGIDTSIKALSHLVRLGFNVELKILGSGPRQYWQDIAKKHNVANKVIFVGSLESGEPVFNWLDSIDIYIHPSKKEGLPRALLEAMSRACPAVSTTVAGIPELLESELLISVNDDYQLAQKVKLLISDKKLSSEQARKNFTTSKLYSSNILNERRTKFWNNFKNYILTREAV